MIHLKVFILLLVINGTPPLLALLLPERWGRPIDNNIKLKDGVALLGTHKTMRGAAGGILAGGLAGLFLGFQSWTGFAVGLLGMGGDGLTSFIKRRLRLAEGADVPIMDQLLEGGLPLVFLVRMEVITWTGSLPILFLFTLSGMGFSRLRRELSKPGRVQTPEPIRSSMRFREWRACHTALTPFARLLNFENFIYYRWFMAGTFKLLGLYRKGVANALDVTVNTMEISLKTVPPSFDSYKILLITDLHIDGMDGLGERLRELVSQHEVDLCLLGGDYRMEMYGEFQTAAGKLKKLVKKIRARDGIFGILGNHDCLSIAPDLEDTGIYMLINDSHTIERNGEKLCIAGVDDPHYYQCHDLSQTFEEAPGDAFTILLSHSPEIVLSLDERKIDLILCGHTHGGQIRLPKIGAVFTHSKAPRALSSGSWTYNGIPGYTSRGAGSSGLPLRFNCPPEIVLLTLKKTIAN